MEAHMFARKSYYMVTYLGILISKGKLTFESVGQFDNMLLTIYWDTQWRYKRCPFVLRFTQVQSSKAKGEEILVDVDSGTSTNDIPGTFKIQALKKRIPWVANNGITSTDDSKKQKPVILTRGSSEQNPFGSSYLTGYDEGIVMEVMKNGCVPTLVLFWNKP